MKADKAIVTVILVWLGYTFWTEGRMGNITDNYPHVIQRTESKWNVYIHGRQLCEGPYVTYRVGSIEVECE